MPTSLLVVDNPDRWPLNVPDVQVVAARKYLTDAAYASGKRFRVINLCRSYRYQSAGYYVSLLAEARLHRPTPSIATMVDMRSPTIVRALASQHDELIQSSLKPLLSDRFTLSIYFGRNLAKRYQRLCRALFEILPAPLLRAQFVREDGKWSLQHISAIPSSEIPADHRPFVVESATEFFTRRPRRTAARNYRFDLAILVDPKEKTPPSDERALKGFEDSADDLGIATERITAEDYGRLNEFDGLFIRATTAVNHYTYRFARKAEAEGLAVIDDPASILRCTNKVFLGELLQRHGIDAPRTVTIHRDNVTQAAKSLGFPIILKQPDSSFSQGVVKAADETEYTAKVGQLLEQSDLIIGQEFVPTGFDWRVGILEGRCLYVCRYLMARGHWQIYNHAAKNARGFSGGFEAYRVEDTPANILEAARKAAGLMGQGLYGVDLKEVDGRAIVIEVNDNPSIEHGVENAFLKNELYREIMGHFLRRMEARRK
jgi:glutathione synthase/RimK-type ligase-like ATP-grasp enzyme